MIDNIKVYLDRGNEKKGGDLKVGQFIKIRNIKKKVII